MSTLSALLPAAISAIIGFGSAHYISKKITANTKAKKVINFLLFVSLGVGITGVLNEILIASILGTGIKTDKLTIYIFSNIIVLPSLFLLIGYGLDRFQLNAVRELKSEETAVVSNLPTSGFWKQKSFLVSLVILSIGLLIGLFGKSLFVSDDFNFSECTVCEPKSGCIKNDRFKGFKVLDDSIQIFMLDSNNMDRIFTLPVDDKMKCSIVKTRNNAFDCRSFDAGEYITTSTQAAFDGKTKFIYNNLMSGARGGVISDSKISCNVD